MTVFKTFLKILNKNKFIVILYTVILVFFSVFTLQTGSSEVDFKITKPDILIVCDDELEGITKNLTYFLENNTNVKDIKMNNDAINDALFYRDVSYIIYINKGFREDFLNGKNPKIEIKSVGDYEASIAEILLNRYLKVASSYQSIISDEEELITKINETLESEISVEVTSKTNTSDLEKMAFYFNFTNYSILATLLYIVSLILASFKEKTVNTRTIVSSMNYKVHNRYLLLSNMLFAFLLFLIYVIIGFILIGNSIFSLHGLIYIINFFIFTFCALTIAFLIGNIIKNKNAISGIVNVVALGTSFLCGSFVPMEWIPDFVLKIAHILPSYYFIKNNELLKNIEVININNLNEIIINMGIVLGFAIIFIIITNIMSKRKRII